MEKPFYHDTISSEFSRNQLAANLRDAQHVCHGLAAEAGWWTDPKTGRKIDPNATPYLVAAKLMLCVTELAEACEGHRKDLMDDKLPHRSMIEVELADTVIRCLDLAGAMGLDVGGAIVEKLLFNSTREDHKMENRAKTGGKAY